MTNSSLSTYCTTKQPRKNSESDCTCTDDNTQKRDLTFEHESPKHKYFHLNMGVTLILWDWLFGTLRREDRVYTEDTFVGGQDNTASKKVQ